MSRFTVEPTPLAGLVTVQRQPLADSRGFLARMFCAEDLAPAGWTWPVAQINHTHTAQRGTVRGLHFQHPRRPRPSWSAACGAPYGMWRWT